jgi:D,D-heptose 1,7-bisphosphate phosphatase
MQAVILAGGRGTRLKEITGNLPKPLMDIDGKPLLVRQLELMRQSGIGEVLLLTGYRSDAIRAEIGDGARFGLHVLYAEEDENNPLGTAGALLDSYDRLGERILVAYGDCMLNVDLPRMVAWHEAHRAEASLLVHPNSHPEDSDLVETDAAARVVAFHPYPHEGKDYLTNLVNAALYVIDKKSLAPYRTRWLAARPSAQKPDIAKYLFPEMLAGGARLFAYRSPEYIKDAGTPKRYASVVQDLRSGRIARATLSHPQKAIFLDRDGTLNEEVNRVSSPEALRLIEGVAKAVRRINESEYRAIVVTNQPVLARGDCDERTLAQIHAKLDTLLAREGAYLDALYYCPHHPHSGYPGEVPALKIACTCRKPKPGMLLAAQADFNIDFSQSWMIGDSTIDIRTANGLALRSVLLQTGKAGSDAIYDDPPAYTFKTLLEAVEFILEPAASG